MFPKIDMIRGCFVVVVVGIVMLFLLVWSIQPVPAKIGEITVGMVGQTVVVNATVKSVSENNGDIFMTLKDVSGNGTIKAIVFAKDTRNKFFDVKRDDNISVTGKVDNYYGELEIVIKDISYLKSS